MRRLTENEIIEKLQAMDLRPLEIKCQAGELYRPPSDFRSKYQPDALIDIAWGTRTFQFVAEIKTVSTPKLIDEAIWQLTSYLEDLKNKRSEESFYPLIVAPYLNDSLLTDLTAREISGIDLSGNIALIVSDELLFSRTGRPNKYPSGDPIKNVYRWSSSVVARVFLSKPEYGGVGAVYDEIISRGGKTSMGTVSKVLKAMEDDLFISRSSGTIRLIDAKGLLNKLAENYRTKGTQRTRIKVADVNKFVQELTRTCDRNGILFAIDKPQQYAVFPTVGESMKIYLENIDKGLENIDFENTDRFANVEILETSEPSYYFDRRFVDDTYYTSALQTYLDLMKGGKREQEVAQQLAGRILSPGETA